MTKEELNAYRAKKDELWNNVKVSTDGSSITIELVNPTPYFPYLTTMPIYAPVNEAFYQERKAKGDYTLKASGLNSNGPWIMKEWKHNESFKYEKNPHYWNRDNINIDAMNIRIVNDVETRTNLLKTGQLDGSAIQAKDIPEFQDIAVLEQYGLQPMVDKPDFTSFYIDFNHTNNPITQNVNIRKAMSYALDRQSFVQKINIGDRPALGFVPMGFPGLKKSFREEVGIELFEGNQKVKARDYLVKGLEELGLSELPEIEYLMEDSDIARKIAEKFQEDWAQIGIKVNLVPLPWGEKLSRLQKGDFDLCTAGWGPDYPDPMTFLEVFESTNPNNHGRYSHPEVDRLIRAAKTEADPEVRMKYLYEVEKLLFEDMALVSQYYRIAHWTYKNYLTGVVNRGIGVNTDFYWADIDMEVKLAQ
ncbi:oligopeptide transport system substrate-binding protein [Anaerovirgula multivorans]|uniref:Oligopeptide transport system substrate-binding protein n=1 Tax=Anaerovirgula multivorans TaxID=312168 RepID=A0A239G1Z4_9FIRM|nr:peptide ABC transporter substrate-binding protein [Anaerovirgula multivorans]SNS63287.1 oligopeptide transport system substrate-binding protein [Anaerovirgula multivorans]